MSLEAEGEDGDDDEEDGHTSHDLSRITQCMLNELMRYLINECQYHAHNYNLTSILAFYVKC